MTLTQFVDQVDVYHTSGNHSLMHSDIDDTFMPEGDYLKVATFFSHWTCNTFSMSVNYS